VRSWRRQEDAHRIAAEFTFQTQRYCETVEKNSKPPPAVAVGLTHGQDLESTRSSSRTQAEEVFTRECSCGGYRPRAARGSDCSRRTSPPAVDPMTSMDTLFSVGSRLSGPVLNRRRLLQGSGLRGYLGGAHATPYIRCKEERENDEVFYMDPIFSLVSRTAKSQIPSIVRGRKSGYKASELRGA
jgi:hypothetical protein